MVNMSLVVHNRHFIHNLVVISALVPGVEVAVYLIAKVRQLLPYRR